MSTPTQAEPANDSGTKSYGQIIKSSAVIGGSTAINVVLSIVRTKVMAMLVGPAGMGLFGIYNSILDVVRCVAGMGINTSGVRQIAEAVGSGDGQRLARTVTTLRWTAFLLGAFGGLLLVVMCRQVSWFSFESFEYAGAVALLGLASFFYDVSAGQTALVQGMRRVGDLARISIFGGLLGTILGIGIVYFYYRAGDALRGVVPSMICVAGMAVLTSWWYSRRIQVERVSMKFSTISSEVSGLLKFGVVIMLTTLMTQVVAYLIRVIVLRNLGEDAAGHYQSAWALGGMYVGFILQAMGTDFYPRLIAVSKDNKECNRLVNEQAEVGLLIAGPGVLATLTFAPLVIHFFYSSKFGPAAEVLRWTCLGMVLRVVSWPMGFLLLAKGIRKAIFWCELVANLSQLGLAWLGVHYFKLNGTGMGFFVGYILYGLLVYSVVRSVSDFRWSVANKKVGLLFGSLIVLVFVAWYHVPTWLMMTGGIVITAGAGIYSAKTLFALMPLDRFPKPVRWIASVLNPAQNKQKR